MISYVLKLFFFSLTILLSKNTYAYSLVIIQGVSKTGQTFITRTGKKEGVVLGKEVTFTSDDVSVIAKAISVTRDFTQWEINNNFTETPFRKGEIVTYYDTEEYLWALTPEVIKSKYIRSELFNPRFSLAIHSSLIRGISSSVTRSESSSSQRGGVIFEGMLERELDKNFALAGGLRYASEIINVSPASLVATRVMTIVELRYYFKKIQSFYNARFMLALGGGLGRTNLETATQKSSGDAYVLPITKAALVLPLDKDSDIMIESAFENVRSDLEFADKSNQSSNDNNLRFGLAYKKYF